MLYPKQSSIWVMLLGGILMLVSGCQPIQPITQAPTEQTEVTATAPSPTETPQPAATPTVAATAGITETADTSEDAAPVSATIEIKLFQFQTPRLEIAVGTTVSWKNQDDIQHSVTAGMPDSPGGLFDSDFFTLNQEFSFTFTEPGEYPYFCKRHKHMQGVIGVTG